MKNPRAFAFVVLFLSLTPLLQAHAHEGHEHPKVSPAIPAPPPTPQASAAYPVINQRYQEDVLPIFEKKCFDCHSSKTVFPSYYKWPGVKQFIDGDINEAKEHLDFDPGFPFKSHATPEEDLKAIGDEVAESEMPPFAYKLMHRNTALTDDEKQKVQAWVQFGLEQLKK